VQVRHRLGHVYRELGLPEQAEKLLRTALDESKSLRIPPDDRTKIAILNELAMAQDARGNSTEAIANAREGVARSRRSAGPDGTKTLEYQRSLASMLLATPQSEEGVALLRDALPLYRKYLGEDHTETIEVEFALAQASGDEKACIKLSRELSERYRKRDGE